MRSPRRNIVTPNRGGPRDDRHHLARRNDGLRRERSRQSPTNRAGADDGLSARRPSDADARRPSPVVGPGRVDIRQSHAVWTGEDFARYPRNFERDCAMLETVPVDVIFAPEPTAMYAPDAQTSVDAGDITNGLCG